MLCLVIYYNICDVDCIEQESIEQLKTKNVELLVERDARGIASLGGEAANEEVQKLIQGYIKEIEELR